MVFILCNCEVCCCSRQIEHVWLDEPLKCWSCSKGLHSGALKRADKPVHIHEGWYCCESQRLALGIAIIEDECALVPMPGTNQTFADVITGHGWCVTHAHLDTPDHTVDKGHLTTLD